MQTAFDLGDTWLLLADQRFLLLVNSDKEQLIEFLNSAYQLYHQDYLGRYAFFRLLAFTRMRKGEALALNWSDINLSQKTLSISKTVVTVTDGDIVSDEPKTKASNRVLTLDEDTVSILNGSCNNMSYTRNWDMVHPLVSSYLIAQSTGLSVGQNLGNGAEP